MIQDPRAHGRAPRWSDAKLASTCRRSMDARRRRASEAGSRAAGSRSARRSRAAKASPRGPQESLTMALMDLSRATRSTMSRFGAHGPNWSAGVIEHPANGLGVLVVLGVGFQPI